MANQTFTKKFQSAPLDFHQPVIKVIGLGGGGSNAVNRLLEFGMPGVEFITANTDRQVLDLSLTPVKLLLGKNLTRGLGAGGNWKVGEAAAEESYPQLLKALAGADMVFLAAGMGGGTGTGSIAVAARAAREVGAVTVGVVNLPFWFEGGRRQQNAREGLSRLQPFADTLITVPNDRLLTMEQQQQKIPLELAFQVADDVLRQGIQCIAELATTTGQINVDFANVRQVIKVGGGALMSIGFGQGENKALKAVQNALHHPLLQDISIESATGIIVNFTGDHRLGFMEVMEAVEELRALTHGQAEIVLGHNEDEGMDGRAQVILVITGLGATPAGPLFMPRPAAKAQPQPQMQPAAVMQPASVNAPRAADYNDAPVRRTVQMAMMQPPAVPVTAQIPQPREVSASIMPDDIELPAFMRRRTR